MLHSAQGFGLAATVVLASTLAFAPQSGAQSAYVYVQSQGPAGPIYGYSASSSGQLTAIPGSPFNLGTRMVDSNGSKFFTLGKTLLHSYSVGSNGAIGSQLAQEPVLDFAGSNCGGGTGGMDSAVLDHTGNYMYVVLQNGGDGTCAANQSYRINTSGTFTFLGNSSESLESGGGVDVPSILGNESYAFADSYFGHANSVTRFIRDSTGAIDYQGLANVSVSGNVDYTARYPDASPAAPGNYVVLQMFPNNSNPPQFGVFTVDNMGNLTTTNTSDTMPTAQLESPGTVFSPDGSMLAAWGGQFPAGTFGDGVEVYNFNGAAPLTLNTRLLNGTPIDQVVWDNHQNLYAISRSENKLWVYNVTASTSTQMTVIPITSPVSISIVTNAPGGGNGTCIAPANGVNVCSPSAGATVSSPVQINAAASVSGGVYRFEVWSGSTKLVTVRNSGIMDEAIGLPAGTYNLVFDAYSSSGVHQKATRSITVQ